ncbi:MAG: ABC transporter ATP-binding protein [Candidatus Babeliales bacterium]
MQAVSTKYIFQFIYNIARQFKFPLAIMICATLMRAIDVAVRPYILKIIINRLATNVGQNPFVFLAIPVILYIAQMLIMATMHRLYNYYIDIKMIPDMRQKISIHIFDYLLGQSHTFFQDQTAGGLTNQIKNIGYDVPDIIQLIVDRFLWNSVTLIIAVFALWSVNITFALTMFIWSTVFILISLLFLNKLQAYSRDWSTLSNRVTGRIVDVIANMLAVRLFAREHYESDALDQELSESTHAERKLSWIYFIIFTVYDYSFVLMQTVSLYFLLKGWQAGTVSVGDFALVLSFNTAIVDSLWLLTKDLSQFAKYTGRVGEALATFSQPISIQNAPNAKELVVKEGRIEFDQVRFKYKGAEPLFRDKSVEILPGQKVGLVGYSGSGKTTFINLILRMYDTTSGRILIDGQNIKEVTQQSLRRSIATIPQETSLFARSIYANILYGNINATQEQIYDAAQKAHAQEFIDLLPHGYKTVVGERGTKLSGGQRQRVSIARAALKNAPILILDEATSALDTMTERLIQESLKDIMKNKTTLVVAHRLSTLLSMDRILVFDKGQIIQDGSHEELIEEPGLYQTLWNAQVDGSLPEINKEEEVEIEE